MKTGEMPCPHCGRTVLRARFRARSKLDFDTQVDLCGTYAVWTDVRGELRARRVGVYGQGTDRFNLHMWTCKPKRQEKAHEKGNDRG